MRADLDPEATPLFVEKFLYAVENDLITFSIDELEDSYSFYTTDLIDEGPSLFMLLSLNYFFYI